ncbi:MAG: hypothetical protein IT385_19730 [Deltaproteobacteria bacterium]|nr:hypothetical protein [Deltaproteobacteria bacterium]
MRSSILVVMGMVGWACGGGGAPGAEVSGVGADEVTLAVAPTPVSAVPVGTKLGVVFTANVLGELEPCG